MQSSGSGSGQPITVGFNAQYSSMVKHALQAKQLAVKAIQQNEGQLGAGIASPFST
jgi:hypothetical protein